MTKKQKKLKLYRAKTRNFYVRNGVGGMGIIPTVFQSINILLTLSVLACVITSFVLLLKVLFKLNKALDIWLKQNEENK